MVILRKIKSATLVEALIATLLIVIIFTVASLVLNNLLLNTFSKSHHKIDYRINELNYGIQNETIKIPYEEVYADWNIVIKNTLSENEPTIELVAIKEQDTIFRYFYEN